MADPCGGKSRYVYCAQPEAADGRAPIVLIHGAGHDHSVWQAQVRALVRHGRAVRVPDLPGHGRSDGPPVAGIEALAQWTLEFVIGPDGPAVLVGHSMGSLIALEIAARAPERVAALILAGSAAPMPVAEALLEAAAGDLDRAHMMINRWSFAPASQLGPSPQPGIVLSTVNRRLMERQPAGTLHTDLTACNDYANGPAAAARVRCPTLLLCGERDQMTPPRAAEALRAALCHVPGGARIMLVPGAGHVMMAEAPDPTTDALREFIDATPGAATPGQ
jgi:pimeloyl-ACP methyl ester carboxylesterase